MDGNDRRPRSVTAGLEGSRYSIILWGDSGTASSCGGSGGDSGVVRKQNMSGIFVAVCYLDIEIFITVMNNILESKFEIAN